MNNPALTPQKPQMWEDPQIGNLNRRQFLLRICIGFAISTASCSNQNKNSVPEGSRIQEKKDVKVAPNDRRPLWRNLSPSQKKELINATKKYVEQNGGPVAKTLANELKHGARYILVGEHHLPELEGQRRAVANSLSELKKAGLTHIGLEIDRNLQFALDNLHFTGGNPEEEVRKCLDLPFYEKGIEEIVVNAKKLGLPILCIDNTKETRTHEAIYNKLEKSNSHSNEYWAGLARVKLNRDREMFMYLKEFLPNNSKIIIFIGCAHVNESPREEIHKTEIVRIATHLAREFGKKIVVTVQDVLGPDMGFDGWPPDSSKTPPMNEVLSREKLGNEVKLLPNAGPVAENPTSSDTDYIIFGGYDKGK